LSELTTAQLQTFHASIEADVHHCLTLEGSVAARDHVGGTAPAQVARQANQWLVKLTAP
jgi:argininosuccinate lyase